MIIDFQLNFEHLAMVSIDVICKHWNESGVAQVGWGVVAMCLMALQFT